MTASDQLARPPDAPPPGPEWKPIPGAQWYEASHRGQIRSLTHTSNGRRWEGRVLKPRLDGDGYEVVNITYDVEGRKHNVSVARLVLLAHVGACPPGMEACHGPGGQRDNRFPEGIRWDLREVNWAEALETRMRNNPAKPKPTRTCPACGRDHRDRGRRCHDCVVELGVRGARLLADGVPLEDAAGELDYDPRHLLTLAVKYGGLRFVIEDEVNAALRAAAHVESPRGRLRRVLFRREGSRQNSDAQ